MTGVASLVFFFLDPSKAAIGAAEAQEPLEPLVSPDVIERAEALASDGGPNSYAVIYRFGGLSAAVAFVLTLRLARELS